MTFSQSENTPGGSSMDSPLAAPHGRIAIRYRDFRGQDRTFVAEAASARRKKNHLHVKVEPKGACIVLSRDRILNLSEVEAAIPQRVAANQDWPSPRERQVLSYHKRLRSTSPLYESIRARFPNW
jgi:hypothetical protein